LQEEVRRASRAAMMGELTASLAHELNQPLGAILSNAQAARRLLAGKKPNVQDASAALDDVIREGPSRFIGLERWKKWRRNICAQMSGQRLDSPWSL
jgi:signal transduction histidine kinase